MGRQVVSNREAIAELKRHNKELHTLAQAPAFSKELLEELEYLRYFYDAVDTALGPASDDVYYMIAENYDGVVPKKYRMDEDDD